MKWDSLVFNQARGKSILKEFEIGINSNLICNSFIIVFSYQAEVNRSMGVYRQKYEDWFNALNDTERKAETARMNSTKSVRKQPAKTAAAAAAAAANAAVAATNTTTTSVIHEPKIVNVPSNCTPAGPAFSITNLTPVVMQQGL